MKIEDLKEKLEVVKANHKAEIASLEIVSIVRP